MPLKSRATTFIPWSSTNTANTCSPSVAGVEDAIVLSRCILPPGPLWTTVFQMVFPEVRSMQRILRVSSSSTPVVRNTRPPDTIGDDRPLPGISVRHAMLSVALHFIGASVSRLTPSPRGPRHAGQSSPRVHVVNDTATAEVRKILSAVCVSLSNIVNSSFVGGIDYCFFGLGERGT